MVNVKQSFVVKPETPTPTGPMCISDLDQEKPITHGLTFYLYRPFSDPFSFTLASQALRHSLSRVLVHFYPLAGRLNYISGAGGRMILDCDSSGAVFYEAESNARMDDFKDFALPDERQSLVPSVNYAVSELHEVPLLMVQLTQLSCGGVALGIAVSNIMMDGTCASHFIAEWARIARGNPLQNEPFLDRKVLLASDPPPPPGFKHDRFKPSPLLIGQPDDQEERNKKTTLLMLHLSKTQVDKLKEMANQNRPEYISRPFSRFEAVAGHIWKCGTMARLHQPLQQTNLYTPVSIRDRIPLPNWYFGNAIMRKQAASSQSGELVSKPLAYACGRIREAIDMVTEAYVKSALDDSKLQKDLNPFRTCFDGNPNMALISWLGIPLEGLDFGWGKSVYMGPATISGDGKGYILPGESGEGSVSVALRFQVAHVENFVKYFYQIDNVI